jgi:hypothetical protein
VLGTSWLESEDNFLGTWTRVGTTDEFNATWAFGGTVEIGQIFMTVDGPQVSVDRLDNGNVATGCTYSGTLAPDGVSVTGSYTCSQYRGYLVANKPGCTWIAPQTYDCVDYTGTWSATIER